MMSLCKTLYVISVLGERAPVSVRGLADGAAPGDGPYPGNSETWAKTNMAPLRDWGPRVQRPIGKTPRAIAHKLNKEGVDGPTGKGWGPTTIHGNRQRGTGILNNEIYIGRLVWNRLHYVKDPDTGKRVSKLNPESE